MSVAPFRRRVIDYIKKFYTHVSMFEWKWNNSILDGTRASYIVRAICNCALNIAKRRLTAKFLKTNKRASLVALSILLLAMKEFLAFDYYYLEKSFQKNIKIAGKKWKHSYKSIEDTSMKVMKDLKYVVCGINHDRWFNK